MAGFFNQLNPPEPASLRSQPGCLVAPLKTLDATSATTGENMPGMPVFDRRSPIRAKKSAPRVPTTQHFVVASQHLLPTMQHGGSDVRTFDSVIRF